MNDALGMDVRGMPITAFFDPASRDSLSEAVRDLLTSPALVEIDLTARRSFGRKPIRARMLLLPMSDAQGQISRIVGCLDIQGGLGKTPRRFQVSAMRRTEVTGEAPQANLAKDISAPRPITQTSVPSYEFAEGATPFRSSRRQSRKQGGHKGLRLVVDNAP